MEVSVSSIQLYRFAFNAKRKEKALWVESLERRNASTPLKDLGQKNLKSMRIALEMDVLE